jgi:hypothetical protein
LVIMGRALKWALALTLASSQVALAQSAEVSMQASRTRLAAGDTFVLEVRADVQGESLDDLEIPDLQAFEVLSRQVSRPFSFSFGFGRGRVVQSSTRHTFTLRALEPGTHRLAPARAVVGGRSFRSAPLTIEVRPGAGAAAQDGPSDDRSGGKAAEVEGAAYDSHAFLRTVVDRADPWVGEQVTVSIHLYVRGGLSSAPVITQEARADGFWTHDLLPPSRTLEATRETVRGVPFRAYELRRFAAFPLRSGELTIDPMEVRLETGSLLGLFQGGQPTVRKGVPVTVRARALPDPARTDVEVGRYRMEATLDRHAITTGDAVTLRVRVEGTGNVRDVQLALPDIPGLRSLAPRIEDDIQVRGDTVGGTRTFEWLLVAEQPGTYRIPSLTMDTFEPGADTYRRLRTQALDLEVVGTPVATQDEGDAVDGPGDDHRADPASLLGPLRPRSALRRARPRLWNQPWYAVALAVPPLAWLALFAVGRLRQRVEVLGRRTAPMRSIRQRLRRARHHAEAEEPRPFYGEVAQAVTQALTARLGTPVGGLTHPVLHAHLLARGMDGDLADRIVEELDGCDYARFSATGVTRAEMDQCLARVDAMLERIHRFRPSPEEDAS